MTKIITHANLWWWGKSYTFISDDGMATIEGDQLIKGLHRARCTTIIK